MTDVLLEIINSSTGGVNAYLHVYVTMLMQVLMVNHAVKICMINNSIFSSPAFLFSLFALLYSFLGECVFLTRDLLGFGMGGDPTNPLGFFRRFGIVCYFIFLSSINSKLFDNNKIIRSNFSEQYYKIKLLVIFLFSVLGIYILTDGFSHVAVFSDNPDEVRYANRANKNIAIGSLFVLFGINSFVIITDLVEKKIISRSRFFILFLVNYFPLALSASRLLMFLPFVVVVLLKTKFKKITSVTGVAMLSTVMIVIAYIFGAYRSQGSLQNGALLLQFIQADFFPEFSGAVYTQTVTKMRTFITPFSTMLSGFFPSFFTDLFGVDKSKSFQMSGAVIGDIWNSQYSIRISLIGELLYSAYNQLILFSLFFACFIKYVNYKILSNPGRYRDVYVVTGLLCSLCIPYGAQFMVATLHYFVFSLVFFHFFDIFSGFGFSRNLRGVSR